MAPSASLLRSPSSLQRNSTLQVLSLITLAIGSEKFSPSLDDNWSYMRTLHMIHTPSKDEGEEDSVEVLR